MHYPTREQPVVSLPAKAAPRRPRWYVVAEDNSMSLRLVPGAVLCEGEDGDLVASVEDAAHAARFDIVDGELWATRITGRVEADETPVDPIAHLTASTVLVVGTTQYVISDTLTQRTGPVPMLVHEAYPQPLPAGRDEAAATEGMRLFYEEPTEVEEIVITEPAARPHLVAAREQRTGRFPDSTVPAAAVPATEAPATPVVVSAPTQFFKTPTLRVARSQAKSRLPGTALMFVGLIAAAGYAAHQFIDREAVTNWISAQLASWEHQETIMVSAPAEPFELNMAQRPEPKPALVEERVASTVDPRFEELTTYVWLRDVNAENHERLLTLAASLLSSENAPPLLTHVTYYVSRLEGLDDRNQLERMTRTFGSVFSAHPEYRDVISRLEQRVAMLSESSDALAAMNRDAELYFSRNALTLPPGRNVVSTAQSMLALDDRNADALRWITRTADLMVERADEAADAGDIFEARNLIEEVLAFAPAHTGANALWLSLARTEAGT